MSIEKCLYHVEPYFYTCEWWDFCAWWWITVQYAGCDPPSFMDKDDWKIGWNSYYIFFQSSWCKIAGATRNSVHQAAATTVAFFLFKSFFYDVRYTICQCFYYRLPHIKGTLSRDFRHFKKPFTWARYEQPKQVTRNFSFSRRYSWKDVGNVGDPYLDAKDPHPYHFGKISWSFEAIFFSPSLNKIRIRISINIKSGFRIRIKSFRIQRTACYVDMTMTARTSTANFKGLLTTLKEQSAKKCMCLHIQCQGYL